MARKELLACLTFSKRLPSTEASGRRPLLGAGPKWPFSNTSPERRPSGVPGLGSCLRFRFRGLSDTTDVNKRDKCCLKVTYRHTTAACSQLEQHVAWGAISQRNWILLSLDGAGGESSQ